MSSFKGNGKGNMRSPMVPLQMSFTPMSAGDLVRAHPGTARVLFRSTPEERRTRWVLDRKELLDVAAPSKVASPIDEALLSMQVGSKSDVPFGGELSVDDALLSMQTADSLRRMLLATSAVKPAADADADPITSGIAELVSEAGAGDGDGAPSVEVGSADMDTAMSALAVEAAAPRHLFMTSPPGIGKTTIVQKLLAKLIAEEGEGGIDIQGFITEEVRDSAKQRSGFDLVSVAIVASGRDPPRVPIARIGVAPPKVGKYTVDVQAFEDFALPLLKPPSPYKLPDNARLYTPEGGVEVAVGLVEELPVEEGDDTAVQRCIVTLPSTGEELTVEASALSPAPIGWKPACKAAAEEDRPRLFICDEAGKMELMSLKFGPAILESLSAGGSRNGPSSCVLGTLPQPAKGQRDHELVDSIRRRRDVRVVRMTRNNRDELVDKTYAMLREGLGLGPPGTGVHVAGKKRFTEDEIAAQEKEILRQHEEEKAKKNIADAEEAQRKAAAEEEKKDEKKKKKKDKKEKRMITPQEAQARIDARKRKRAQAMQEGGPVALDSDDEGEAATVPVNAEAKGKVASVAPTVPAVVTIEITDTSKKRAVGVREIDTTVAGAVPANGKCILSSEAAPPAAAAEIADTAKKRGLEFAVTQAAVPGNGKEIGGLAQAPACVDPAVATVEVVNGADAAAARRARRDANRRAAAAAQAAEDSVLVLE